MEHLRRVIDKEVERLGSLRLERADASCAATRFVLARARARKGACPDTRRECGRPPPFTKTPFGGLVRALRQHARRSTLGARGSSAPHRVSQPDLDSSCKRL